jgi:hypothetical protein
MPPESCAIEASWGGGEQRPDLFPDTGSAVLTLADGAEKQLSRELRCEVLRDANGEVVAYVAGFADQLPVLSLRASVLVSSGYNGDGVYENESPNGGAVTVELVLYDKLTPCLPHGGCVSGTYPASLSLTNDGRSGVATTDTGYRLEYECRTERNLSISLGKETDLSSPPPGTAYVVRRPGYVLEFDGIECQTEPGTRFLTALTQPSSWSESGEPDRAYGLSIAYKAQATTDSRQMLPVNVGYDYFGTIVKKGPTLGTVACEVPFAGTVSMGVSFQCP